jgi:hypothetical protein
VPGRAGRLDTVSRIASVRLGVDLVALLEGHQIVRQATAVLTMRSPRRCRRADRGGSPPRSPGLLTTKTPTGAWRIRGIVAPSLTRECDAFRHDKAGHTVARLIDTPVADEHEIEPFTREEARPRRRQKTSQRHTLVPRPRPRHAPGRGARPRWAIEQGVHVRVVQKILGHARVTRRSGTPTSPSPRSATRVPLIGRSGGSNETRNAATRSKTPPPVSKSPERVLVVRRLGDLNPGWTVSPNRISSSDRGRSEPSHLGQRVPVISPERHGTAGNCNGNCNWGNALDDARPWISASLRHRWRGHATLDSDGNRRRR